MTTHTAAEEEFDAADPTLTRFDLVKEGARRDGVEIVHYAPRFPVPGTRAEKRIERLLAFLFLLTGPQNMPVFGNNQLSPDDKAAIIAYIQNLNQNKATDPGGWSLGRYGPVPEGLVIFLVGIAALVFATLWIAGKS